jgi:hypothetical protein
MTPLAIQATRSFDSRRQALATEKGKVQSSSSAARDGD